jgi:hypothetical protein
MMSEDWEKGIFSDDELKELSFSSERIVYNLENGIAINMGFNNDFCISLCKRWYSAINNADITSIVLLHGFFQSFIDHIEAHLDEEGIDWRYEPEV